MIEKEHEVHYRGRTERPDISDVLEQYRFHLKTWCVYKRRHRKGQGWDGMERAVVVDEPAALAVIEMANLDLGPVAAKILLNEFKEFTDKRDSVGNRGQKLPVTAWSARHKRCVLCHTTKSKHKRGGRCYTCCRAAWLKKAGFNRLHDAIYEGKNNDKRTQTQTENSDPGIDTDICGASLDVTDTAK